MALCQICNSVSVVDCWWLEFCCLWSHPSRICQKFLFILFTVQPAVQGQYLRLAYADISTHFN